MHVIKKPHYAVYNLVKYRKKKKKSVPQFLSPNMRKKVTNYLLQSVQDNIFNCPKMASLAMFTNYRLQNHESFSHKTSKGRKS